MTADSFKREREYRRHESIKVILLVDTEAPRVTVWRTGSSGRTAVEVEGLEAAIDMPEIDASLPHYLGVEFEAPR